MNALPVAELKAQFSEVLEKVKHGASFGILYGRKKAPVAMIIPYPHRKKKSNRKLGVLDGKVNIQFSDDFKMTEEDLLRLK